MLIVAALLLALAVPAGAVTLTTHPFVSSFDGTGSHFGAFGGLGRVAVSDATGSIYAIDNGNGVVDKFDATGAAQAFTTLQLPAGSNALDGSNTPDASFSVGGDSDVAVDNSGSASDGNVYVDSEPANSIYAFDATGSYLYTLSGFGDACGVAVDTRGDVWVSDYSGETVTEFTSAGAPTGTSVDTSAFDHPCHIAFDSNDNLYVNMWQAAVEKFDSSGNHLAQVDAGPSFSVAVDRSTDHVYVNRGTDIAEYDSSGTQVDVFGSGTLSTGVGVAVDGSTGNPSSGDVIVSDSDLLRVDIFGPLVTQTLPDVTTGIATNLTGTTATVGGAIDPGGHSATCAFEYGTDTSYGSSVACSPAPGSGSGNVAVHADLSALTPGTTYHYRLDGTSADGTAHGLDQTFTTPQAPAIGGGSATAGATSATLKATVNPGGGDTTYHFDYGTTTSYGASAPAPDASAGSGTSDKRVSVDVSGLQPGTTYHFRVVASNAAGTTDGPDHAFATGAVGAADTCPNAQVRAQQGSAALPDCRAWELVSQADKARASVLSVTPPSADGNRIVYNLLGGAPGTSSGAFPVLVATRTAGGWASSSMLPPASQLLGHTYTINAVSANADGIVASAFDSIAGSSDTTPNVAIARLGASSGQTLLHQFPTFFGTSGVDLAASDDLGHVYASVPEAIAPSQQPGTWGLYDFGSATPQLVGTMPSTGLAPTCGILNGSSFTQTGFVKGAAIASEHWTSTDGDRVFFQSVGDDAPGCNGPVELYTHDRTTGRSTLVSGPPVSGDPDNGVDRFLQATPDGSVAYFRTATSLTAADDADGDSSDMDVYRWTASDGAVACITCAFPQANVLNPTLVSDDGSHVYFSSVSQFDGAPAGATGSRPNLYVWRDGAIHFIARADGVSDLLADIVPAQATPDGNTLMFVGDTADLNARSASDNGGTLQYYRYDDRTGDIACISCPADGSAATVAAKVPAVNLTLAFHAHLRIVSDDGSTLAFATQAALVPQDHNDGVDIYAWHDGRVGLITSGMPGTSLPALMSLSPSGRDVFFREIAALTWDAQDASTKLYDARVDGGFLAPPGAPSLCQGDQCRGPVPGAPALADPSSPASGGASAPAARLTLSAISSRRRALFARTGRLSLAARVNVAGTVSATATAKLGRHAHTVARASAKARKGGTVKLRLRLSKAARAQLAHGAKLRLTLVVHFGRVSKRVTLTLVPATANGR